VELGHEALPGDQLQLLPTGPVPRLAELVQQPLHRLVQHQLLSLPLSAGETRWSGR
jgi:hypothetical protein